MVLNSIEMERIFFPKYVSLTAEQKEEDATGSIGEDEIWGHLQKYRRQIESSSLEHNTEDRMENIDLCKNTEARKSSPSLNCSQKMKQVVVQFLRRFNFWQTVFPETTMGAEMVLTTQCNAMDPTLMQKCANVFFKFSLQYQNIEEKIQ